MTKWIILFYRSILYAFFATCFSYYPTAGNKFWISSVPTFEEPNLQPLSRIVQDNDHVFVAGRNVLYRLDSKLNRTAKFVTGPEPDNPQCFLDQPCDSEKQMVDNENQVLDVIDSYPFNRERRMLLVCGSLYHGLCQLRSVGNVSEYSWIKPYNDSLGFSTIRSSPYRKTRYQTDYHKNITVLWSALHDDPAVRTHLSPPFLSKKVLTEADNGFRFEYGSENGNTESALRFEGNATRYVLESFQHQHQVYFVIVRTSSEGQVTTRLGRVCSTVQSYAEMTIACHFQGQLHDRATAAYYGRPTSKLKLDHGLDDDDHMLYVSLANYKKEQVMGQTVAGFSMRAVVETFESGESGCLAAQEPIAGVDCHPSIKYIHPICGTIDDNPRLLNLAFKSKIIVAYIRPPVDNFTISALHVQEQHEGTLIVLGTSHGYIFKGNLNLRKFYAITNLLDSNETKGTVHSPLTIDKTGLHLYIVVKHKVVKYPLYSCSPHTSCPKCVVNGKQDHLDCVWCNGRCTQAFECEDSTSLTNASCPPFIKEVIYEYNATRKGTVFTISGYSFGSYINSSHNNVTVTNSDCEVETWNNTQVTCTLTTPPKRQPIPIVRLSSSSSDTQPNNDTLAIFGSDVRELNLAQYRFPKLYAMFPSKGPESGGTHVIIYGENLDTHRDRVINVRGRRCMEIAINDHAAWCATLQSKSPELNDTISFQIGNNIFEFENTVPESFNWTGKYRNFTYLPDPQIYQIQPGITTISGLMNVSVVGRHLDSVETPEMVVRVPLSQSESVLEFKEACWSDPSTAGTTLTCRTPPLRHPGLPLPTRSFPLVTHVGFLMDGLEEYRNLHRTREVMSRLMYYPDPEITPFRGIMRIPDNETVLEIKGRHLDLVNNPDNLQVIIGDHELCKIISLHPSSLQCELPAMLRSNVSILGTNFSVEVMVGVSSKNVGILSIIENPSSKTPAWILVAIICGSFIVLGVVVWYFWHYKKAKKSLTELTLTAQNGLGNQYTRQAARTASSLARESLSVNTPPCEVPLIANTEPLIANMEPLIANTEPLIANMEPLVERETLQLIKEERLLIDLPLLIIGGKIGAGQFGFVYEGLLQRPKDGTRTKVAVKTIRNVNPLDASEKIADFLEEALIMKDFKHPNVLSLIGISFEKGLPLVVLPYMENGDLCKYLREHSKDIKKIQLFQFAMDVANGMTYLAKTKFVHRDLATRNCILDSELNVRVADFGMSRDIYEKEYYSSQDTKKKLPIKWMAPESMEKSTYSEATDVWSYGVLLWELMTFGSVPYANIVIEWDVLPYVKSGRRLTHPEGCPLVLYDLMLECWKEDSKERPCFEEIRERVSRIYTDLVDEENVDRPTIAAQNPDSQEMSCPS